MFSHVTFESNRGLFLQGPCCFVFTKNIKKTLPQVQSFFFIRHDGRNVRIDFQEILYIEARKNYTRLVMEERPTVMVLVTLKQWERVLPRDLFCRIHRGYIVSVGKLLSFDNKYVYLPGERISIGEQYRTALPQVVTVLVSESARKEVFSGLGI
jgi:DNA-binding LytR/AlgR family response regulator